MTDSSKFELIQEMLESAEASIRTAKSLFVELAGGEISSDKTEKYARKTKNLSSEAQEEEGTVVEGVFDGQSMIGANKKTYPVPANYASKSKLVPGDILKLTIKDDGTFLYKQISPVDRKRIMGTLTYDDGEYKVLAEGKVYSVLLASVTYFKGDIGDKVSLVIPADEESEWGAVEHIIASGADLLTTDEQLELTTKNL